MQSINAVLGNLAMRWRALTDAAESERGDSPVGTAVITAILVAGAVVVATAIIAVAQGWVDIIPEAGQ